LARQNSAHGYVREVGGEVVSSVIAKTSTGRIELYQRQCQPRLEWHFCQPELTLFWHREGFNRMRGRLDGASIDCRFRGQSTLSIIPPESEIRVEFDDMQKVCDYAVIFFDPDKLGIAPFEVDKARLTFANETLCSVLGELFRQSEYPDDLFQLFAEGVALQALASVGRSIKDACGGGAGLSPRRLRALEEFIRENLMQPLTIDELADVAGISKRHFQRVFRQSVGVTPYHFLLTMRIEEAKRRLARPAETITDIAFNSGFSHTQHFSAYFRKMTGFSPSEYRKRLA
jgi:AraC family transcriptional regulator